MRGQTARGRLVSLAVAPLLLASGAFGQDVGERAIPISELIDSLGDDRFEERERATAVLEASAEELSLLLEQGLDLSQLSLEQTERISAVLQSWFLVTPRAALGVRFGQFPNRRTGIGLQEVLINFPSRNFLRAGDIVMQIDDFSISDIPSQSGQQLMRAAILSRNPGETLPMVVLRDDTELSFEVPLGEYRDLDGGAIIPDSGELTQAWSLRSSRLGLNRYSGETMRPRDTDLAWPQARHDVDRVGDSAVAGGGESRSVAFSRGRTINESRQQALAQREELFEQRREELLAEINTINLQIQVLERQMQDPTATEAERRNTAMRLMSLQGQLGELARQLEIIDGR
jgi:hypothetical protein